VAMQGDIAMQTVATFIPSFFTELRSDGLVDRAMAVARGAIQDETERWKPMLFMRLRTGRLWTPPDLSAPDSYRGLPSLVMQVNNGTCVPILGPGTYETLSGSRREIARRWAQENQFPLGPDDWNDLPRVAQYVAVTQKSDFVLGAFQEVLASEVKQRFAKVLPPELQQAPAAQLLDLLRAVAEWQRANDPDDTYRLLADLPIPLYVTTNPSKRLYEALIAAGKEPAYATCPWIEGIVWPHSTHDGADPAKDVRNPLFQPDPQHPLVYHVFGHLENLESLVLTEDSIFDYLIGVTRYTVKENKGSDPAIAVGDDPNPSELPHIRTLVNSRLARSSLLFLGFPVDDWTFRVLLRTIIDQPGSEARKKKPQLAVQLDPEDDRIENPAAARGYLAEYLREAGDIDVFWTGVEDFVKELHDAVRPATGSPGTKP
jgi:hypothetical protein